MRYFAAIVPYVSVIVPLLAAGAGWGLVHVLGALVDSPTLEYCGGYESANRVTWAVENLSRKTVFRGMKFAIVIADDEPGQLSEPAIESPPPYFSGRTRGGVISDDKTAAHFFVPAIHPGSQIFISANYEGPGDLVFRFLGSNHSEFDHPSNGKVDEQPTRLMECGILTFFVKYEVWVVTLFVAFLTLLALVAIVVASNVRAHGSPDDDCRV